ncbi:MULTISPECIES: FeoA family protein [Ruminococcus]|jgi:ferrous iron transport protein A|uniref:FeoA domain protein n=1 Tax=Ruminococcus albus 8 TaxID=246199 RepID=E9SCY3_RUMAL|nr:MULTISPECIES: FeoA family protein [Ruminococcus]MBE6872865.1 ferrous iron transport protein A [Ruminococcus albus]EGC02924.1 FeoA domain protein [Ruminococcus albus 8]MBO5557226.1 ferrous iron transport protein A [Ruminococcus sp.]MBQ9540957.1 ferrous iron transport protein A [Ruminococcus sp.]MBR0529002.1 ferrous iron transport protein A [Ruminococcus sp.]
MPLTLAAAGETNIIKGIDGTAETKRFLENLGFKEGCSVTVINSMCGSLIVGLHEDMVAVSQDMAARIIV